MGDKTPQRRWRTVFRYIIPLFISVGLCYLLFTGVDLPQMMEAMRRCNFSWFLSSLLFSVAAQLFRAWRWRLQLRPIGINPPFGIMVNSIFGTYAVNLVLPRLGEIWRTGYISQRQRAPFTAVFGSMVADRMADTITVLTISVITFAIARGAMLEFIGSSDIGVRLAAIISSPWIWTGIMACCVIAVWGLRRYRHIHAIARIRDMIRSIWQGFSSVLEMPRKGLWLLLTVLIWGSYFVEMWVSMYAFDATAGILHQSGVESALIAFVFGSLAMAIPSNGGIGPWQGAVVLALSGIYGMDSNTALAFATLSLGLQTLLTIILGLYTFISIAIDKRRNSAAAKMTV